jgi:hypothetical protein
MPIQLLPEDVIAQIKSSTTITSLNGVIAELLKNTLDAGSTKADISVDYSRGGCVVEDNGLGILPSEFGENGGLGKLYREYFEARWVARLTDGRFVQTQLPESRSWWSWSFSRFTIIYGFIVHHVSSPSASLS